MLFFYPNFHKSYLIRYLSSMKHINIHHFPENLFQDDKFYQYQHHLFLHSRHSSVHCTDHHYLDSSSSTRGSLKSQLDSYRLPHVREQNIVPICTELDNIENTNSISNQRLSSIILQRISINQSNSSSILNENNRMVKIFLTDYLGHDGILVLYLLKINTNEVITGDIVTVLFELFQTNYQFNIID